MITQRRMLDRVKVLNPTRTGDPRTDPVITWPDPATVADEPGWLRYTASQEVTADASTTVTSDWLLSLQPSTTVTADSRVIVNGERFEVVARPEVRRKRGRPEFVLVRLRAG